MLENLKSLQRCVPKSLPKDYFQRLSCLVWPRQVRRLWVTWYRGCTHLAMICWSYSLLVPNQYPYTCTQEETPISDLRCMLEFCVVSHLRKIKQMSTMSSFNVGLICSLFILSFVHFFKPMLHLIPKGEVKRIQSHLFFIVLLKH